MEGRVRTWRLEGVMADHGVQARVQGIPRPEFPATPRLWLRPHAAHARCASVKPIGSVWKIGSQVLPRFLWGHCAETRFRST